MTSAVMRNDSVSFAEEEEHLRIPIIGAERPAMMKDNGLRILGAPVLVEDFRAVGAFHEHRAACLFGLTQSQLRRRFGTPNAS